MPRPVERHDLRDRPAGRMADQMGLADAELGEDIRQIPRQRLDPVLLNGPVAAPGTAVIEQDDPEGLGESRSNRRPEPRLTAKAWDKHDRMAGPQRFDVHLAAVPDGDQRHGTPPAGVAGKYRSAKAAAASPEEHENVFIGDRPKCPVWPSTAGCGRSWNADRRIAKMPPSLAARAALQSPARCRELRNSAFGHNEKVFSRCQ